MKKALLILLVMVSVSAFAQRNGGDSNSNTNDRGVNAPSSFTGFNNLTEIGDYSFTGSEATMSPRFFRSGTPGDACSTFSSGNFQYVSIPLYTDGTGSLTVNFDPLTCGTGVFVTFHTEFNPANICSGYIWSFGSSQAFTETFEVPANSNIEMIISGVANAPGVVCGPASYQIDGIGTPASIPVLGPAGMVVFAGLLGMMAVAFMVRKKAQA